MCHRCRCWRLVCVKEQWHRCLVFSSFLAVLLHLPFCVPSPDLEAFQSFFRGVTWLSPSWIVACLLELQNGSGFGEWFLTPFYWRLPWPLTRRSCPHSLSLGPKELTEFHCRLVRWLHDPHYLSTCIGEHVIDSVWLQKVDDHCKITCEGFLYLGTMWGICHQPNPCAEPGRYLPLSEGYQWPYDYSFGDLVGVAGQLERGQESNNLNMIKGV